MSAPRTARLRLAVAVLAGLLGAWTMLVAPTAGAAAATKVEDDGWWWRLQTGVGAELPPPPNVGDDQLLIQSSPEGAQAIMAMRAVLLEGQVNPILTLDVADDQGGGQAILLACQVGASWTGTHAGTWDSKPLTDCESGSVTGIRSDDGSQWVFALGPLQFNDKINIVIVPGIASDASSPPSFSLVFEAPTAASIQTVAGAAPPPTSPTTQAAPTTTAFSSPPPTQSGGGGSTFTPPPTTSAPAVVTPPVVNPVQPALDDEDQGQSAIAPILQEALPVPNAAQAVSSRTAARIVGLLILLGAAALGFLAYRSNELVGQAATSDTPVTGGLARFRHERTHEPVNINI